MKYIKFFIFAFALFFIVPPFHSFAFSFDTVSYSDQFLTYTMPSGGGNVTGTASVKSELIDFTITDADLYSSVGYFTFNSKNCTVSLSENTSTHTYSGTVTIPRSTTDSFSLDFDVDFKFDKLYFCSFTLNPVVTFLGPSSDFYQGDKYFIDTNVRYYVPSWSAFFDNNDLTYGLYNAGITFCGFAGSVPLIYDRMRCPLASTTFYILSPTPISSVNYTMFIIPNTVFQVDNSYSLLRQASGFGYSSPAGFDSINQTLSNNIDSINQFENQQFSNLNTAFTSSGIENMDMSELVSGFALVSQINNYIFNNAGAEYQTFLYGLLALGVIVIILSVIGRVGRGFKGG